MSDDIPAAAISVVATRLNFQDRLGHVRMRLGLGRASFRVKPGLYAAGRPNPASAVFVTANYRYSFDLVRAALDGIDAWLLVLDTRGINVWCAAGKGTFGTFELCRQIAETGLADRISHRTLILPQLGAVGVAAHQVAKVSGFRVVYGPVRAADIPAWLANGKKKDESMRLVSFGFRDRLVLAPVELSGALPALAGFAILSLLLALALGRGIGAGFPAAAAGYLAGYAAALLAGAVVFPLLLPWLPGQAFSAKGGLLGAAGALALWLGGPGLYAARDPLSAAGLLFGSLAIAAFAALNFTGATVFTSQSGTSAEMKFALPVIIAGGTLGLALQVLGALIGGSL